MPGPLANIARMLLMTSKVRCPASMVARSDLIAFSRSGRARVSQFRPALALRMTAVSGWPTSWEMAAATASIDISRASRSRFRAAVDRASRA